MNNKELEYFKEKLYEEKRNCQKLLQDMKENGVDKSNTEYSQELSVCDNHPSDSASDLYEKEKDVIIKEKQLSILEKISESLSDIDKGTYGICAKCGKEIPKERLEFIPYAKYCASCQREASSIPKPNAEEAVKPKVTLEPYGKLHNYAREGEDALEDVMSYNDIENTYEGYAPEEEDPLLNISNDYYKRTLD